MLGVENYLTIVYLKDYQKLLYAHLPYIIIAACFSIKNCIEEIYCIFIMIEENVILLILQ